jgi:arabinose-5-phosphate isomerase
VVDEFMTNDPKWIAADALVEEAVRMFDEHKITALFVMEGESLVGVLHIHDCRPPR